MDNLQEIRAYATTLSLVHTKNELEKLIHEAERKEVSYTEFLKDVLGSEIRHRQDKAKENLKMFNERELCHPWSLISLSS